MFSVGISVGTGIQKTQNKPRSTLIYEKLWRAGLGPARGTIPNSVSVRSGP